MIDRTHDLKKTIDAIERLKSLIDFSDCRAEFSEAEVSKMTLDLKKLRRSIIDELSNTELARLKAEGLDPEGALAILDQPAVKSAMAIELEKTASDRARQEQAERRYYTADKSFEMPTPGVSLKDLREHDYRVAVSKFVPVRKQQPAATISAADAYLNHHR